MTGPDLEREVLSSRVVVVAAAKWARVAGQFEVIERHQTGLAGELFTVRIAGILVAVEQPVPGELVLRALGDEEAALRFVQDRLDQYERMWDGCGCKIDYYGS